jgi:hypothetical protein
VYCFTIQDGQLIQFCRECAIGILGTIIRSMNEEEIKKYLEDS